MNRTVKIGLIVCTVLAAVDALSLVGTGGPAPFAVNLVDTLFGVATLIGVWYAWRRQSTAGYVTVVVSRILSALSAVPAFFATELSAAMKLVVAVLLAIALAAVWMVSTALRERVPVTA